MVFKIQGKPFWLATQLSWLGWVAILCEFMKYSHRRHCLLAHIDSVSILWHTLTVLVRCVTILTNPCCFRILYNLGETQVQSELCLCCLLVCCIKWCFWLLPWSQLLQFMDWDERWCRAEVHLRERRGRRQWRRFSWEFKCERWWFFGWWVSRPWQDDVIHRWV